MPPKKRHFQTNERAGICSHKDNFVKTNSKIGFCAPNLNKNQHLCSYEIARGHNILQLATYKYTQITF